MLLNFNSKITKITFKVFISVLIISTVVFLFYPFSKASRVIKDPKVVDGDTFKLTSGSDNVVVRLKDVDTPETSGYNTPDEFKGLDKDDWRCLERWGYRAKNFLEKKLEESTRLEYRKGVLTVEKGSYGRLLGRVYLNGSNQTLGELIVQRGYGRSYGEEYRVEEREARNNSRGLWQCGE